MKFPISLSSAVAAVLLLTGAIRGQEQEEPKPGAIAEKAQESFMISCGAAMSGVVPGFEWFALGDRLALRVRAGTPHREELVKHYKELKAYPRELIEEFHREAKAPKQLALRAFTQYVLMLRSCASLHGDNASDVLSVALGEHTEPMKKALLALLKTGKDEDRLRAAAILLDLVPDHAQASAIVAAELRGEDKDRRILGCELAGTLRLTQADVLMALVPAVQDKDDEVRQAAAYAVGNIGPKAAQAVPGLIDLLKSGDSAYGDGANFKYFLLGHRPQIRNLALQALGKMGEGARPAVPIISGMLAGAADDKRDELLKCLAELGPVAKEAAPDLRRLQDRNCLAATAVLLKIDPEDAMALDRLKTALQSKAPEALKVCATYGPRVKALIPLFIAALKEPKTAARASEALGNLGPLAEEAIPALVAARVKDFENFSALAKIGKASVPALMRLLQDRDVAIRVNAVQALGLIGRDAAPAVPVLIEAIKGKGTKDEELALQFHAVIALGRMKSSAASARDSLNRLLEQVRPENEDPGRPHYIYAAWALTQLSR